METKEQTQYKKIKCPLCNRLLFLATTKCIGQLQVKCTKCSNKIDIELNNEKVHFKNDKTDCTKLIV